ncbi:unnamed protein product [Angiostrongylus costaricensis]|uniref:Reverse transcriptase domain-containing protein n=1 Tax=Angiostrongylus costaricensis TaxID=334426 RepID=A0A0R3PSN7_ANGCS|nr:unnamed protein product [Angiostrongylus costaricensis]
MGKLEWDEEIVTTDGRVLYQFSFTDDITPVTSNISQAERILSDFDNSRERIGVRLNLAKTMVMKSTFDSCVPLELNGMSVSRRSSYACLLLRKQDERPLRVIECAIEKTMLGVSRVIQVREVIRGSPPVQRSKAKGFSVH